MAHYDLKTEQLKEMAPKLRAGDTVTLTGTVYTARDAAHKKIVAVMDAGDKLRIFHDFYRTGEETAFHFDITQTMRKGHDFKDFICPDTFEFESDCFRMGDRYGRVIFLREYAAYIKDIMVAVVC